MLESFIHYLWKFRLLAPELVTTRGEALHVEHPGQHNSDSGPDFFNAKIRIGGTLWAGNVEIHLRSSDWQVHGHHTDKAYDGIILHVVYEDDLPLKAASGHIVPCLEVRNRFDYRLFVNYERMIGSGNQVPCAGLLPEASIPAFALRAWFDRLLVERMQTRIERIGKLHEYNKGSLEETFYQWLARSFGFRTNAQPFEMLARSLPHRLILQHAYHPIQTDALVFGQSGLLVDDTDEDYPQQLINEYAFLREKHSLKPLTAHIWKLMRLRPVNFPHIRLAQWSALLSRKQPLLSEILKCETPADYIAFFRQDVNPYWHKRFRFGKVSVESQRHIGDQSIELLLINTVAPFLFFYAVQTGKDEYRERSIDLLHRIQSENNAIIREWKKLGVVAENAGESQALLELKNSFCSLKKCLDCAIGVRLIGG